MPARLYFTDCEEANTMIAKDPMGAADRGGY